MTRPDLVDEHGTRHRHGCTLPGWTTGPIIAGVRVHRCTGCGAIRITREKRNTP